MIGEFILAFYALIYETAAFGARHVFSSYHDVFKLIIMHACRLVLPVQTVVIHTDSAS